MYMHSRYISFMKKRTEIIILLMGVLFFSGWMSPTVSAFPENTFARNLYIDKILGPIDTAADLTADVIEEPGYAHQVQFFVVEDKDLLYFCFYHGKDIAFESPVLGSVVLQRSRESGELIKMKIFYKDEADSYISIEPVENGRSDLDIMLLGIPIQQDIILPFDLTEAAGMSVSEIMRYASVYVDWNFYFSDEHASLPELTMTDDLILQIRPYLKQLNDTDDGAVNREGKFVFIDTGLLQDESGPAGLNCSGFAKWVVDGVLYPLSGGLLSIDELKQPHPDYRGNRWSEKVDTLEDPYFGLDWTRNLAVRAMEVRSGRNVRNPEEADVDYLRYHPYKEDVGYSVASLKTILYELARTNPNHFYIGSVNTLVHGGYELRKHFHVAVLFPWLDDRGNLRVSIMERTRETGLDEFINRYEDAFIHLVQIRHDGVFKPGEMQLDPTLNR